jgi:hypothetical protein
MATEKFCVFNEAGTLKRLKGRIVRFLDNEDPSGSDKSAIRTSLEVSPDAAGLVQADIGTAPNEIPVNGMLGDLAYQSADSVSMGTVEAESLEVADQASIGATSGAIAAADDDAALVLQQSVGGVAELSRATDTDGHVVGKVNFANRNNSNTVNPGSANYPAVAGIEAQLETTDSNAHDDSGGHLVFKTKPEAGLLAERLRLDSQGLVGVNNASPGNYNSNANNLVVGTGSGSEGLTIATGSGAGEQAKIFFANGATPSGTAQYQGYINFEPATNTMLFGTAGTQRWSINSSGNLVANSTGIDFGSGASTTLNDYEEGTFTPTIYYQNSTGLSISYTTQNGYYTKIGNTVTVHAKVVWTVTGTPVNDNIGIQSFPFSFAQTDLYLLCVDSAGVSSIAQAGVSTYYAAALNSSYTGNLADDIGSGSKTMIMSGTYLTNQ